MPEQHAGSLVNHIADASNPSGEPKPRIGMGATIISWSDRHAATIVSVSRTGHQVEVTRDKATRTDDRGMSEVQEWAFEPQPDGPREVYTRRRDGRYRQKGGQGRLILGLRDHYHDFSF